VLAKKAAVLSKTVAELAKKVSVLSKTVVDLGKKVPVLYKTVVDLDKKVSVLHKTVVDLGRKVSVLRKKASVLPEETFFRVTWAHIDHKATQQAAVCGMLAASATLGLWVKI